MLLGCTALRALVTYRIDLLTLWYAMAKAGRSRLVVCTECLSSFVRNAADALRAYVQRKLEMSTFYAVLGVRPHTVCNRNLDIRTGQGDLGS